MNKQWDKMTLVGLGVGVAGIVLGNVLEGGHLNSLIQFTAAIIVFAGTFGATMVANSQNDFRLAMSYLKRGFQEEDSTLNKKVANQIVEICKVVRKDSMLSAESFFGKTHHPFIANVLKLAIDGVDAEVIEETFFSELDVEEQKLLKASKVWADAGGFAPTIGIIGAVLGLIHVMGNLTNTASLGKGIAVAFVATIYGVASANLFFIPISNKIKAKVEDDLRTKEMIITGIVSIAKGHSPYVVSEKLRPYWS